MLIVGCNTAFRLAFGHNMASGVAFGHNLAYGPASGLILASGPAFGHKFASGAASGLTLASGLAFGHKFTSGAASGQSFASAMASGQNLAFGAASGQNFDSGAASGHKLSSGAASGHNMASGLAFGHNIASGTASGYYMASGPAFGHNFASGVASGHNMASGAAFGHNFASGAASGQNLAFDHNGLFELITAFSHVKLIIHIGHTNGLVNHNSQIQPQLIVATAKDFKIYLFFQEDCRIFYEGVKDRRNGLIRDGDVGYTGIDSSLNKPILIKSSMSNYWLIGLIKLFKLNGFVGAQWIVVTSNTKIQFTQQIIFCEGDIINLDGFEGLVGQDCTISFIGLGLVGFIGLIGHISLIGFDVFSGGHINVGNVGLIGLVGIIGVIGLVGCISLIKLIEIISLGNTPIIGFIVHDGLISHNDLFGFSLVGHNGLVGIVSLVSHTDLIGPIGLIDLVCQNGLVGFIGLKLTGLIGLIGHISLGHNSLVSFIGLGLIGFIGLRLGSLFGLIGHIIGLNGLNGFSLVGLSGPSDIMGHISLIGLGCFIGWLTHARKKILYSNNNDPLQDHFAAAILAAAAKTHGVAIKLTSATRTTNAAIWYYCAALLVLHPFICKGEVVVTCVFYHRLDSLFFGDALQNAKQIFSTRLSKMMKYCVMKECENILRGYLYVSDLAFVILKGIYGFKFPKRFLEISSRDLTSFLLQLI
jgi:hypothetical protein